MGVRLGGAGVGAPPVFGWGCRVSGAFPHPSPPLPSPGFPQVLPGRPGREAAPQRPGHGGEARWADALASGIVSGFRQCPLGEF